MDWHWVFLIAGGPSVLLTASVAFMAMPARLTLPTKLPARAYVLAPTYLIALAGGILSTFGASALVVWSRSLIVEERHISIALANVFMAAVGLVCGIGGVVAGGYLGDALTKRGGRGGHARAIGLSLMAAVPFGVASLLITAPGDVHGADGDQRLSAVRLQRPRGRRDRRDGAAARTRRRCRRSRCSGSTSSATRRPERPSAGLPIGRTWPPALQSAVAAMGIAGVLFMIVARRQGRETVA